MLPALTENTYVICWRTPFTNFKPGQLIVIQHITLGIIIKRTISIDKAGFLSVAGDNPASTSTKAIGSINPETVLGRVIYSIR